MQQGAKIAQRSFRALFAYGLIGGAVSTLLIFIGSSLLALPYPPQAIFQILISPVPGSIQSIAVETLREYAKYGAFTFATGLYIVLYAILAVLIGLPFRGNLLARRTPALLVGSVLSTLFGLGFLGLVAAQNSALSSQRGWMTASMLMLGSNLAYASLVVKLSRARPELQWISKASRREFLKKIVIIAAVLAIAGLALRVGSSLFAGQPLVRSETPIPVNGRPDLSGLEDLPSVFRDPRISDLVGSEVTDNRVFYRVDINPFPPQLEFDQWSLKVTGKVKNPVVFNKATFLSLPIKEEYATLECVSNTIDPPGALISNAKWTGVSLSEILQRAEVMPDAKFVIFKCADGYTVGIPLDRAMHPGSLLAYKMNDEFLPREHGAPLRAIVPGIYGMMNAKWITEIEVIDRVYLGYWQERGWSNEAKIKTTSIIYYPAHEARISGTTPIAGVAFAGDRGISKVEVSADGGKTWNEATLKKPRSPYSWVLWAFEWTPSTAGTHRVVVKATDELGEPQDSTSRPSFPDGATGFHSIQLKVS